MAIALKNLLLLAEDNNSITVDHLDGTTSTLPFFQRSFDYPENGTPLILKDLPGVEEEPSGAANLIGQVTDNFVRGGAIALGKSVVDDVIRLGKVIISPNGLAWSAAQLALATTNPQSLISPRNRQTLPVSTLLTAGTGAAGIRFRKDGLIDIKTEEGFNYDPTRGGPKYESSILEIATKGDLEPPSDHTIRGVYDNIYLIDKFGSEDIIKEYNGGAHSTFGIGKTTIKRYKADPYRGHLQTFNTNLFELKDTSGDSEYRDYRTVENTPHKAKPILKERTRINLYNLGDPGLNPRNIDNPQELEDTPYNVYDIRTIDKISAASIFKREFGKTELGPGFKDYIKFRIAVVDTENPLNDNIILFRALLDDISDSYSGEWNSYKYNGRAEKFYTYDGFDRSISFGFKIHTQTRHEQKPLWEKLNYLVAQTAPEYKNRRMRGVFSRLTIGDWMYEIPGFFTGVNLSWSTAYPWEIKHDPILDSDVNEYPHILDVSCDFQPVHNFAPSNSPTTPFILPDVSLRPQGEDVIVANNELDAPQQAPPELLNTIDAPTNSDLLDNRGLMTPDPEGTVRGLIR